MAQTASESGEFELSVATLAPTAERRAVARWRDHPLWRDALLRRMLALADVTAALVASLALVFLSSSGFDVAFWSAVFLPVWPLLAKLHGLYDRDHRALRHLTVDELSSIVMWALTGTAAIALLLAVTPAGTLEIADAFRIWVVAAAGAFALRALARFAWRRITPGERTMIIGVGPLAEATRRKLELFPDIHVRLKAERDEAVIAELSTDPAGLAGIDRVILASHAIDEIMLAELVKLCRREHVKLSVVPPARGLFGTAVHLNHVADLPLVEYNTWDVSRSTLVIKRVIDVALSSVALIVLAPLFLVAAAAIRLESRGPAFFRQQRAGQGGRPFAMYKFRTMVVDAEERLAGLVQFDALRDPMFKLKHDPRVTRIGRLLRKTSIDELPQLVNVLKGEMSIVGPRPEQVELVERYRAEHRFRLAVKPGITGPMQVFGRGELAFEERLAVEREYIENLSISRDLRILAMTPPVVLGGKGAF